MAVPKLIPAAAAHATAAGIIYHIDGELVPVLRLELGGQSVYFEHHLLLWKDPTVTVGPKAFSRPFKRNRGTLPIFMAEAKGTGRVALSHDAVGQVVAVALKAGDTLDVREHQLLAATAAVQFESATDSAVKSLLFGHAEFVIDHFACPQGEGVLWLRSHGNLFEQQLGPGEQFDVDPGAWIYKDRAVKKETIFMSMSAGLQRGANMTLTRFTGPGRVGFQSLCLHEPTAK
jgi:uncharacterized protein (AIM24 family)